MASIDQATSRNLAMPRTEPSIGRARAERLPGEIESHPAHGLLRARQRHLSAPDRRSRRSDDVRRDPDDQLRRLAGGHRPVAPSRAPQPGDPTPSPKAAASARRKSHGRRLDRRRLLGRSRGSRAARARARALDVGRTGRGRRSVDGALPQPQPRGQAGGLGIHRRTPRRRSLLVTETRAQAVDDKARRRFRLYWRMISSFAALTRRLVLRAIAAEAERRAADKL